MSSKGFRAQNKSHFEQESWTIRNVIIESNFDIIVCTDLNLLIRYAD